MYFSIFWVYFCFEQFLRQVYPSSISKFVQVQFLGLSGALGELSGALEIIFISQTVSIRHPIYTPNTDTPNTDTQKYQKFFLIFLKT